MGIFFIAAGNFSKNRDKTLDKPHSVDEICNYLTPEKADLLKSHFSTSEDVFIWGANKKSFNDLSKVKTNEYVVDVKNKEVVQVFNFCFFIEIRDGKLQEYLGWDREKQLKRSYNYVYFLKIPRKTSINEKGYFQKAFGLENNSQWLVGQKYFDDTEVISALRQTSSESLELFLGISEE